MIPLYQSNSLDSWIEWLDQEPDPDTVEESPEGGKHIPIHKLKPLLSILDPTWGTENFKWNYLQVGGMVFLNASVELMLHYGGKYRRLTGSATFDIATYQENTHYVAIGLANATKSAAKTLGRRFGSELNKEDEDTYVVAGKTNGKKKEAVKMNPDKAIREEYARAAIARDDDTIQKLESMYNFENNAS